MAEGRCKLIGREDRARFFWRSKSWPTLSSAPPQSRIHGTPMLPARLASFWNCRSFERITFNHIQCPCLLLVASARIVDQLEKALLQSEERVTRLESWLALGFVALAVHVFLFTRQLSSLNGTAGGTCDVQPMSLRVWPGRHKFG